jgi:hypothetical protein
MWRTVLGLKKSKVPPLNVLRAKIIIPHVDTWFVEDVSLVEATTRYMSPVVVELGSTTVRVRLGIHFT